jgi:hypothetical protein
MFIEEVRLASIVKLAWWYPVDMESTHPDIQGHFHSVASITVTDKWEALWKSLYLEDGRVPHVHVGEHLRRI